MTNKRPIPPRPNPEPNPDDKKGISRPIIDPPLIDPLPIDPPSIDPPSIDPPPIDPPPIDPPSIDPPPIDPPPLPKINVDYEYFGDRSYIFIYGPPYVGKTVLIASIYEYLTKHRSAEYCDKLIDLNRNDVPYERLGSQLRNEFVLKSNKQEFPDGTAGVDALDIKIPKHLNFRLEPNHKQKPPFEFCFMDMAGEDLRKIDFNSDRTLPKSIKTYIEDVPQKNLCFIYLIDPDEATSSKIEQIQLFNAFLNLLDNNKHGETPVLILISKWDLVNGYKNVEEYLKCEFPEIWGAIRGRGFSYAEFSIGKVKKEVKIEKIEEFDYTYPERVFNWIYKSQMNKDLIEQPKEEGWWVRLFKKYL